MSGAAPGLVSATTLSTGLVAVAVAAAVLVAPLALLMRRDERIFPLLAIFALPFRLPVSADGRTVNLLIPLYIVVAAGTLAHLPRRAPGARGQALADRGRGGDPLHRGERAVSPGTEESGKGVGYGASA